MTTLSEDSLFRKFTAHLRTWSVAYLISFLASFTLLFFDRHVQKEVKQIESDVEKKIEKLQNDVDAQFAEIERKIERLGNDDSEYHKNDTLNGLQAAYDFYFSYIDDLPIVKLYLRDNSIGSTKGLAFDYVYNSIDRTPADDLENVIIGGCKDVIGTYFYTVDEYLWLKPEISTRLRNLISIYDGRCEYFLEAYKNKDISFISSAYRSIMGDRWTPYNSDNYYDYYKNVMDSISELSRTFRQYIRIIGSGRRPGDHVTQ